MVTRMMIMAIFAMSLDLLQDVTGLVSLGHAAYFGLTGYALAFLTPQGEAVNLWWTLPVAVLASATAALIIGFSSLAPMAFTSSWSPQLPEDEYFLALQRLGKRAPGSAVTRTACVSIAEQCY